MLSGEAHWVDVRGVVPIEQLKGDSESETPLLREMEEETRPFLSQFQGCEEVAELQLGAAISAVPG